MIARATATCILRIYFTSSHIKHIISYVHLVEEIKN